MLWIWESSSISIDKDDWGIFYINIPKEVLLCVFSQPCARDLLQCFLCSELFKPALAVSTLGLGFFHSTALKRGDFDFEKKSLRKVFFLTYVLLSVHVLFLTFWTQWFFVVRLPVLYRMFSIIPASAHWMPAASQPSLNYDKQKCLQTLWDILWVAELPPSWEPLV